LLQRLAYCKRYFQPWLGVAIMVLISACSSPATRLQVTDNNELFREFKILVSNQHEILDAAYQTLLYLYPSSLIMPIVGSESEGFVVDVESWDLELFEFNRIMGFGPVWEPSYGYQVRMQFSQTLGRTENGSIVTGYRYSITTIPRGLTLFYIDEGSYDIDLVFRSMLMKYRIPSIYVTHVV